ncbi:hypothetical protein J6590_061846 [Homalodisca vitripennis]|nr:hypothetical protein J6590_061846 [Homalodisca vitripennis]
MRRLLGISGNVMYAVVRLCSALMFGVIQNSMALCATGAAPSVIGIWTLEERDERLEGIRGRSVVSGVGHESVKGQDAQLVTPSSTSGVGSPTPAIITPHYTCARLRPWTRNWGLVHIWAGCYVYYQQALHWSVSLVVNLSSRSTL